jgi:kumamolisin
VAEIADQLPRQRRPLTRAEYAALHGASPEQIARVEEFARANGLTVVRVNPGQRSVVLAGPVSAMNRAFGVQLAEYGYPGGTYRGRTGAIHLPADLAPIVEGVFGLDNRPQARPHVRPAVSVSQSYTPLQVAQAYDFPGGLDGTGESIAILELGGGYSEADLQTYFSGLGIPTPAVSAVSILNAPNAPGQDPNADAEVMLDIEVAGAVAPGAKIVVYFAPNTDQGFLDALTQAIHDTTNNPSVVSISWGGPESSWTDQALTAFDQALQSATLLGVTVCCAAGDNGAADGVTDGRYHADFPASDPYALACGGTKLAVSNGAISSEVVWNEGPNSATGGGVSDHFPLPPWQANVGVPFSQNPEHFVGRGLPDVAGDADPSTGYKVRVDGEDTVVGGTSAVAPLWSGLIARINQQLGKPAGYLNALLYTRIARGTGVFRDITQGNNNGYNAGSGWDPCTGWGAPDGAALLAALDAPASGGAR